MADVALYRGAGFDSLRWDGVEVTPDDDNDLARPAAAVVAASDGMIQVTAAGGTVLSLYANAGFTLPVLVDRVHATGTTATGIVALYGV